MRQRQLLPSGDFSYGSGLPFLANTPDCVAQAILTRMRLYTSEWFLDTSEGLDLKGSILGFTQPATRDLAVQARILDTEGVLRINQYVSLLNKDRQFTVLAEVETIYGAVAIELVIIPPPPVVIDVDFIGIPQIGDAPLVVSFSDETTGGVPNIWLWNFGDGETSTLQNPIHTYPDVGLYTVSMTATIDGIPHSKTKVNYIEVDLAPIVPIDPHGIDDCTLWADFTDVTTMSTVTSQAIPPVEPGNGDGVWWVLSKDSGMNRRTDGNPERGMAIQDISTTVGIFRTNQINGQSIVGNVVGHVAISGKDFQAPPAPPFLSETTNYAQSIFTKEGDLQNPIKAGTWIWCGRVNAADPNNLPAPAPGTPVFNNPICGQPWGSCSSQCYDDGAGNVVFQIIYDERVPDPSMPGSFLPDIIKYLTWTVPMGTPVILTFEWEIDIGLFRGRLNGGAWQSFATNSETVYPGETNWIMGYPPSSRPVPSLVFQADYCHSITFMNAQSEATLDGVEAFIATPLGITLG